MGGGCIPPPRTQASMKLIEGKVAFLGLWLTKVLTSLARVNAFCPIE